MPGVLPFLFGFVGAIVFGAVVHAWWTSGRRK